MPNPRLGDPTAMSLAAAQSKVQNPKSRIPVLVAVSVSVVALALAMLLGPRAVETKNSRKVVEYAAEIVKEYPHDEGAFCQGLVIADGTLYESTGREGFSTVRRVDLETGKVEQQTPLRKDLFGEGLAAIGDKLYQVTWKTGEGFVYDRKSLKVVQKFRYGREGWGLTTDGKHLILSDGTDLIRYLDSETFKVVKRLEVRVEGRPADDLNELEYVDGEIWANVWYQDYILRIDPLTARATGRIDLSEIVAQSGRASKDCVLNGIAWDAEQQRLLITGKWWPKLFEIRIREK